jgi:hypothetical protein
MWFCLSSKMAKMEISFISSSLIRMCGGGDIWFQSPFKDASITIRRLLHAFMTLNSNLHLWVSL